MFLFSPNVVFFLPVPVLTGLAMQAALFRAYAYSLRAEIN